MDSIRRLIRMMLYFLVGVMLSALSILSYADTYPGVKGWGSPVGSKSQNQVADSACKGSGFVSGVGISGTNDCKCTKADGTFYTYATACTGSYYCPAGGTLSGTSCINAPACPSGQARDATTGQCVQQCTVAANGQVGSGRYAFPNPQLSGVTYCVNGCTVYPAGKGTVDGAVVYQYAYVNGAGGAASTCTGSTVSPSPNVSGTTTPLTDPVASGCIASGQGIGSVNGVTVCSGPATTTNTSSGTKTTTPSAGGASTTSTTVNTTCTGDGSCTTTTTVNNTSGGSGAGGTGAGSTTTTTKTDDVKPKAVFCEENPKSPLCLTGSFSGTCDAAPTCEGDAVQCATAKAVFELKCSADKDDDQQKLARGVVAGNDPKAGQLPDPANPTEVPIGSLSTDEIFSASCPSNPTMTAFGHSYTFSLAPLCQLGGVLGQLNVMLALIAALWLIGGSVKGA